jgi:hypothetical protein
LVAGNLHQSTIPPERSVTADVAAKVTRSGVDSGRVLTLRLTQTRLDAEQHHVHIALLEGAEVQESATARVKLEVSPQDRENLRWYLEDYLEYPLDPAQRIAKRVERRMAEIGKELFRGVFGSEDARDLWAKVRDRLAEVRVEVSAEVEADAVLPWELLRDPRTDTPAVPRRPGVRPRAAPDRHAATASPVDRWGAHPGAAGDRPPRR